MENSLTGINIVKPAQESSVNGISRITAKTFGKASDVDFIIKNNADGSMKTVKAFFENAANEWSYYLNSMEIANGGYTIEALAHNGNLQFQDATKIKIENDGNDAPASNILTKKNDEIFITEEKKEPEKIEIKQEEKVITETAASTIGESAASAITEEKAATTEANSQNQTQILNAVVKALSNIYDTINNNLIASENGEQIAQLPIPEGKVAGTTEKKVIKKEDLPVKIIKNYIGEQSITAHPDSTMAQTPNDKTADDKKTDITEKAEGNNWFKYDLKLNGIENGEKISNEKMLSASCNNPLDSVVFIIDNLNTPEIDYKFNALNNYGYYTYWTYKLNPKDIKKGEYLLYARGTIDWQNYESPMIIVEIE